MPVSLDLDGLVAIVTIDEPATRNALTEQTAAELGERLRAVAADPAIGALVVRGAKGTFCSGGDRRLIARARADASVPGIGEAFAAIYETFDLLANLPVPTIAAIRGDAVGAGVNLALAADVRVMALGARFRSGFLPIGLHPGGGHLLMADRVAGPQATVAMSILGDEVSAARLAELGIVWQALPDDQVEPRALELAGNVTDPELVRRATASFRAESRTHAMTVGEASAFERDSQFWSFGRPNPS